MRVIHAQPRIAPSPIDNKRVDRNPPPLLWPAERGEDVRYAVRLSQDPTFQNAVLLQKRVSPGRCSIRIKNSYLGYGIGNTARQQRGVLIAGLHEDKDITLGVDIPSLAVGRKRHSASDATVLIEPSGVQRAMDTLSQAAR